MDNLPPALMMAGLLHDIAKPVMQKQFGNMYMHELKGEKMTKDILTRLKFSNVEIDRISKLVLIHMFNVQGNTKKSKCRVFIADNFDYFDDFVRLRRADGLATNPVATCNFVLHFQQFHLFVCRLYLAKFCLNLICSLCFLQLTLRKSLLKA